MGVTDKIVYTLIRRMGRLTGNILQWKVSRWNIGSIEIVPSPLWGTIPPKRALCGTNHIGVVVYGLLQGTIFLPFSRGSRGRMAVGFTTTCVISAYNH